MSRHDMRTIIRSVVEDLWNTGNLDRADQYFTATYVDHGGMIDVIPGPESVKLAVVVARLAFPELSVAIDGLIVEGDLAEVHWTARAMPVARARLTGVTLASFTAGKIVESWTRWDVTPDASRTNPATSVRFAA